MRDSANDVAFVDVVRLWLRAFEASKIPELARIMRRMRELGGVRCVRPIRPP